MSKFCPNCGRELPDQVAFCDGCGYKMQQAQEQGFPQQNIQQSWNGSTPQNYQQSWNGSTPQNYQQNWNGSTPQNVQQADKQKSKGPLILGITVVALVLLAGGYFLLGSLKGKGGSGSSSEGYITRIYGRTDCIPGWDKSSSRICASEKIEGKILETNTQILNVP